MKLVASMVVRNELGRYLEPALDSLLEFVDEVCVLDDSSDDGTAEFLSEYWKKGRVFMVAMGESYFFENEGQTRQALLNHTLGYEPTHILAIDADELVADGARVRATIEANPSWGVFSLCMSEVWRANPGSLDVRIDGGWAPHRVPCIWEVEPGLRMKDGPASGRVPPEINLRHLRRESAPIDVDLLHFGWTNERERVERHARYAGRDGFGHAGGHIASILASDSRVRTITTPWPAWSDATKDEILGRVRA